ncbi:hypothetical protein NP493_129g03059 [Ridgeia piscesae]|uniref:Uncharacterized protein n=1 Tax=Ridgeia piscesae TaxID=27915 RepID=A0AAD9UGG2_RIDPI|nr:hypothetical protein NP493_129g03059 [Ridgeia piscesae]
MVPAQLQELQSISRQELPDGDVLRRSTALETPFRSFIQGLLLWPFLQENVSAPQRRFVVSVLHNIDERPQKVGRSSSTPKEEDDKQNEHDKNGGESQPPIDDKDAQKDGDDDDDDDDDVIPNGGASIVRSTWHVTTALAVGVTVAILTRSH